MGCESYYRLITWNSSFYSCTAGLMTKFHFAVFLNSIYQIIIICPVHAHLGLTENPIVHVFNKKTRDLGGNFHSDRESM